MAIYAAGSVDSAIGLGTACEQYDILFDGVDGGGPGDVGVLANAEGRRVFSEMLPPDHWRDLLPEKMEPFADWKQSNLRVSGPNGPPNNPITFIDGTFPRLLCPFGGSTSPVEETMLAFTARPRAAALAAILGFELLFGAARAQHCRFAAYRWSDKEARLPAISGWEIFDCV